MKQKNRQNVSENTDGTNFDYTNLDTFPIDEQLEHNIINAINEAYEISNELEKETKNVNNTIDKKLYERCCSIIQTYTEYNTENDLENKKYYVACALYLSFKSENEEFFHEFDQQLKGIITKENWKLVFLNSNLYNNLKLIRSIISKENEYKCIIKQALGISPKNYFDRLKVAEKQIIRGIGRIINKHMNEPISEIYIKIQNPFSNNK